MTWDIRLEWSHRKESEKNHKTQSPTNSMLNGEIKNVN